MDWSNRFNYGSKDVGLGSNNLVETIKNHFSEYIFTGNTPNGIIDLKLDIVGEETLTADCDVTDHYVESNTAYQDQISLKPKIYTVSGEVGELVWYQKDSASQIFGQVAQRLEGVISFLPIKSKGFTQFKTKAMKAFQWVDTASNAISKISNLYTNLLGGSETQSNQQQAYIYLTQFRDERQLISVKTPWGVLNKYVITNMKFTQPQNTKDKSLISITLKEFRTVSLGKLVPFDSSKYYGNAAFENQPKIDNGKTSGKDESISKPVTSEPKKENDGDLGSFLDSNEYDNYSTNDNETFGCAQRTEDGSLEFFKKTDAGWKILEDSDTTTEEENVFLQQCIVKMNENIGF